jgi:hypothetical protein
MKLFKITLTAMRLAFDECKGVLSFIGIIVSLIVIGWFPMRLSRNVIIGTLPPPEGWTAFDRYVEILIALFFGMIIMLLSYILYKISTWLKKIIMEAVVINERGHR